jgi:hypothetical protein
LIDLLHNEYRIFAEGLSLPEVPDEVVNRCWLPTTNLIA